jgi:hypothetical protein
MAITITWNVLTMDVTKNKNNLTDIIHTVHWECIGEDENGVSVRQIGAEYIGVPDANNFMAFESLTKEQVIEWVKNTLFGDGEDETTESKFNTSLENAILKKANPPVTKKMPSSW